MFRTTQFYPWGLRLYSAQSAFAGIEGWKTTSSTAPQVANQSVSRNTTRQGRPGRGLPPTWTSTTASGHTSPWATKPRQRSIIPDSDSDEASQEEGGPSTQPLLKRFSHRATGGPAAPGWREPKAQGQIVFVKGGAIVQVGIQKNCLIDLNFLS